MGNSLAFSQPYIVDEYYSDDDVTHDSGTESAEDSPTPAPALDSEGVSSADTERSGSNTEKDAEDITPLPTTDFNDVSVEDTDSPPQVVEYLPEELITPTTSGNLMSKPGNVDTSTSSITPSGSNTKAASDSDVPSFPSSGGSSAAAVAALHENGRAPIGSQEEDGIDEHDLEAEQKRTLERLDSDLSTFEAVEQSILEASREFDKGLDGREPEDGDGSGFNTKSPAGGQGTASGIPRLQRPTSGRPRSESGNQHLQHENEMARDDSEANQMTSSAYAQVSSSAPSNGDDQLPPSPSTHQLVHSFSTEDTDGGANSLPGNSKRGVSPRRHSGIPVRQNSFHGSSVPAAAAYLLYQGESDSAKGEAWDRPNDWSLRPRATSTCSDRESDGDDLTISDLTGRARKSKKRSGIPAAWIGRSQGDLSPRSVRSGSPRSSEIIDISRPPMDRKVLDLKRWFCISRPQYKTSCGVSSLVSCWNFLFSTLGHGSLKPLTQETAMSILGFTEPFDFIRFGTHTGNVAILRWFQELNSNFRVKGKCYILYKPEGKNRTPDVTAEMALDSLQRGLRDPSTTFIYHCKNHYFCPIGFEDTPTRPQDAYKSVSDDKKESWILIGDTSKSFPPIQCKKWKDITTDLNTKFPAYLDIRREWRGVRRRKYRRAISEMVHCIMVFQKWSADEQDGVSMTTPFDPDIILRANVLTPRVEKKLLRKRKRRKGVKGKESRKSPRNIRKESTDEEKHDKEVEDSEETGKKKCRVRKLHARNSYEERRNDMGKDDDLADLEEFIERDSTDEEVLEPKRGRKKRVFKHMEETYPGKQTDIVKGVVSTNSYTTTWEAEWEEEEVVRILVTVNHSSEEESDIDQLEEEWCQQNLDSLLSSASPPWDIRVEQNWLGETPESDRGTPAFEQEQDGREASVEPREKAAVCWLDERGSDMSDGILIELFEECSSEETEMSEKIMAHASFEENNKDQEISTAELGPETPITSNRETAGWQQEVGTSLALCNKSNSKMESLKHGCAGLRVMNQHSSPALDDPEPGKTKDKIRSGEIRERVKMSFKHSSMPEKFAKNDSFKRTNKSMKKVCSNGTFHRLSMSKKSKENNHTLFGSPRGSFRRPKTEKNSVTRGERGPIMIAEGSKGMNRSIKTGGATNRMSMRNERNKEMLLDIKSRAESWSKYACERMAERTEAAQESEEVRMNKEENQDELRARRTTRMRKVSRDREKNKEELEAEKVKRRQEWK